MSDSSAGASSESPLESVLPGRRHPNPAQSPFVFATMGTVVSLSWAGELGPASLESVRRAFDELDERFSLYRPDSEASRVGRRELGVREASATYRAAYDLAIDWRTATDGAFTPHRPDGVIDLSGVVKAMGVAEAGARLLRAGAANWCLNAGGDVLTSGHGADGKALVVGIVDPADRERLLTQFSCRESHPAVATSGSAERGEHIWRLGADDTFVQVTVAAADILTADVLATAIVAGGPATLELAQRDCDIEVIAAAADGRFWATPAFRA